jgi:hypothetical protein
MFLMIGSMVKSLSSKTSQAPAFRSSETLGEKVRGIVTTLAAFAAVAAVIVALAVLTS